MLSKRFVSFARCVLQSHQQKYVSTAIDGALTGRPISEMPSPSGALPLLGHYLQIRRRPGNLSDLYDGMFKQLGPIFRLDLPGGRNIVCFADPDAMETVYRSEGQYPVRTEMGPANFQWFYGKKRLPVPFVFLTGKKWREIRSKHGKQLLPGNVHSYIPGFIRASDRFLRNVKEVSNRDGYVEDIHPYVMNWSLEATAYFVLGAELDLGGRDSTEQGRHFQQAIKILLSAIEDFTIALPFFKMFPTRLYQNLDKATDELYSIGQQYINEYMHKIRYEVGRGEKKPGQSLIEQWLIEGQLSEDEIIMSAIFMLGAGVDTTPSSLSFLLYELSTHQDVQAKLYDQIVSVLGITGEVDGQSLQEMPYLTNVIREAQRLYLVSPHHIRTLPKDTNIMGFHIPAKTTMMYSNYTVSRSEKYFQEPNKFDPDRWNRDDVHSFATLPFGAGPKSCWGRRFAVTEMKVLLTQICRQFILESNELKESRLPTEEKMFSRPGGPVRVKLIPRKE